MLHKIKALLAAFLITACAVLGLQAPAQAALSDCTNYPGTFCLWKNTGAGGTIWRQTPAQVSTSCTPLTNWAGWNDTVTTFRNNASGYVMQLFWDSDCGGTPIEAVYGLTYDLSGNSWNDQISGISWRWA